MERPTSLTSVPRLRRFFALAAIGGVVLASVGCAARWDEMLSHERDWSYITGIGKPHPLTVVRDNPDGARRAQALNELREPLQNGGNAQDQEAYLRVLEVSATTDIEPLCRLAAVRTLGKYRDPRAARVLEEVYQLPIRRPKSSDDRVLFFTQDTNNFIRKEALVGLEKLGNEESRHLLIRVARQPGPSLESSLEDRQQTQDEKIVAIRALGKYKQQECVDALVYILRSEKDIALRDRAHQSLEESTAKRWPAQREAWLKDNVQPLPEQNVIERVTGWVTKQ